MNALFVDTGALVARVLPRDQHHVASRRGWESLEDVVVRLYSSEHVLDEAVSLLVRHAGATYAARWARDHLASEEIRWLDSNREDWRDALHWLERFGDQKLSFTDCLSFSLMRREGIQAVFGFDHHFALAGYELWPRL
ncbi:MAG TPA: PIN domain-containing protein [Verrucomicrobiota bacterium]|nr:PIN domain-containing protein [Verrucomicrobiota bacterium]HNU52504.1 PIN domain-containing protein [Verrucomicrobiota bacterium]